MNRIKELRAEMQMKQAELASLLSIGQTAVSNYEQGLRDPAVDTIARLCEIFSCSADYLLGLSTQRSAQISDADADLVAAYHAAPESIRAGIDALLEPYMKKEKSAAG